MHKVHLMDDKVKWKEFLLPQISTTILIPKINSAAKCTFPWYLNCKWNSVLFNSYQLQYGTLIFGHSYSNYISQLPVSWLIIRLNYRDCSESLHFVIVIIYLINEIPVPIVVTVDLWNGVNVHYNIILQSPDNMNWKEKF